MPILPKSKPKFIQQYHNLPTLSKFHKPPTLSKLHHDQKTTLQECSKAKIFKHDQSHNDPKFQNNQMTISHHATFNETCNKFFFPQARKPKKNSPWCLHDNMEHGSQGLQEVHHHHSNQMLDHISYHEKQEKKIPWRKKPS